MKDSAVFSEAVNKKTPVLLSHYIPLRRENAEYFEVNATIIIPRDLTPKEAEHLGTWLKAMVAVWSDEFDKYQPSKGHP